MDREGHARGFRPPVVPAKIRAPQLDALGRDRLLRLLTPLWRHRLNLIVAPAGSGKTTLLTQAAAAAGAPVAWYRAERGDGDSAAVLAHLEAATRDALGEVAGPWRDAADAARAIEGADGERLVLVVDDLHALQGTSAEAELWRLLDYLPDSATVLAAARAQPALDLSRLRVAGALLEVGADELRFRWWEVERLFRDFYGEPLPTEEMAELSRRTEGWAAGLQLFHLATRGKPLEQRRRVLARLATHSCLIREYLTRNVLDDLDARTRSFLLRTSVLGRLSAELCDSLLGMPDSRTVLSRLERQQVVTRLADGERWFRYHEVLRSHLETIAVEELGEGPVRELRERAGSLLEETGLFSDALEAYCRAERWAAAERLLGVRSRQLVEDPGWWVELLPPAMLEQDPWVMLAAARRRRAAGHCEAACDAYRAAERGFGSAGPSDVCRRERLSLAVWRDTCLTRSAGWPGLLRQATMREPLPIGRAVAGRHACDRLVGGVTALLAGDVRDACDELSAVATLPDSTAAVRLCARIALGIALMLRRRDATGEALGDAVEDAESVGQTWLARVGRDALSLIEPSGGSLEDVGGDGSADPWRDALHRLFLGWGRLRAGLDGRRDLALAETAFHALEAPVLETWASALLSVGDSRRGGDAARQRALRAEAMSRSFGVPGARALALLALAHVERQASHGEVAAEIARDCDLALPDAGPPAVDQEAAVGGAGDAGIQPPACGGMTAEPRAVAITCFGAFTFSVGDRPLDLSEARPRVRSLLRLLALHAGRPVHREVILEGLWPEASLDAGMRNLHVAMSSLRQVLDSATGRCPSSLIARDGDSYRLRLREGSTVDLLCFDEALRHARTAQRAGRCEEAATALHLALDLYGGDLLPEEGPAEWVVAERERYRAAAVDGAATLAGILAAAGDTVAAMTVCERALHTDRHHDASWRLLVDLHERAGNDAAAAQARHRYGAVLDDLGVCDGAWRLVAARA